VLFKNVKMAEKKAGSMSPARIAHVLLRPAVNRFFAIADDGYKALSKK